MGKTLKPSRAANNVSTENKMVEHRTEPSRVMSLRAGPGEMDITMSNQNLRIHARAVQSIGRQLAEIGDRLDREWAERQPNQWTRPFFLEAARPVRTLTRNIYRGIHGHLWGLKSLSGLAKARLASTIHHQGIRRAEAWAAWVSSIQPAICPVWAKAVLATVALVAMATICSALWEEWIGKMLH